MPDDKVTIRDVYEQVSILRKEVQNTYVSNDKFYPVKLIAYGLAGSSLMALLTFILNQVFGVK